jgi:predicted nuclease of predicted toxin-antitoxin system
LLIKIDEDLPLVLAQKLRAAGYQATTVLEENLGGAKDSTLWAVIQDEGKFLITADKGFADIRAFPPGSHHGILLLRPMEDGSLPILALIDQILERFDLSEFTGLLVVATPNGIRMRRDAQSREP